MLLTAENVEGKRLQLRGTRLRSGLTQNGHITGADYAPKSKKTELTKLPNARK